MPTGGQHFSDDCVGYCFCGAGGHCEYECYLILSGDIQTIVTDLFGRGRAYNQDRGEPILSTMMYLV